MHVLINLLIALYWAFYLCICMTDTCEDFSAWHFGEKKITWKSNADTKKNKIIPNCLKKALHKYIATSLLFLFKYF